MSGVDAPIIRVGTRDDLHHVQAIHDTFYVDSGMYAPVFSEYVAKSIASFHDGWDPDRDRVWLAEQDGRLMGYVAVCHRADDDLAQLRYLWVDPMARGHGIGSRLVQEVMDFARRTGYSGVMLWTMEGLESARRIYQAAGFSLTQTEPAPWHDSLVQQRWDLRF